MILPRTAMGGTAAWLSLAAAPTFAIMALLSAMAGSGPTDALCATSQGGASLTGMATMYGLMSAFHARPWLRLLSRPGRRAHRPPQAEAA